MQDTPSAIARFLDLLAIGSSASSWSEQPTLSPRWLEIPGLVLVVIFSR